jgi:ribosomal protein L20
VDGLNKAGVNINRKALAFLAVEDVPAFRVVVTQAKTALGA